MTYKRAPANARASQACLRNHRRLRLPLILLLLVFSFVSVAKAAEKSVLFIHTNKSNGPAIILYDKAFQSALSGDPSEQIALYNEYTDLWRFVGEDYALTLKDFYQQKYAGQHFDVIVVESLPALKFRQCCENYF